MERHRYHVDCLVEEVPLPRLMFSSACSSAAWLSVSASGWMLPCPEYPIADACIRYWVRQAPVMLHSASGNSYLLLTQLSLSGDPTAGFWLSGQIHYPPCLLCDYAVCRLRGIELRDEKHALNCDRLLLRLCLIFAPTMPSMSNGKAPSKALARHYTK